MLNNAVAESREALLSECDVATNQCERDLLAFLNQALERHLVKSDAAQQGTRRLAQRTVRSDDRAVLRVRACQPAAIPCYHVLVICLQCDNP